jgi:hypothetical protein
VGLKGGRKLPTLAVGREPGGVHFVMVGSRAPVYTVDARLIRVFPEDPADATRRPLPEQLKRDVEQIERRRSEEPTMRVLVRRHTRLAVMRGLLVTLVFGAGVGDTAADTKLTLTTWRIEPSTVKENQPWTVKLWVGNLGSEAPRKSFTVQVLGCDKDYVTCETVYATREMKAAGPDLAPGKLPGREIIMEIKQGLGKGEHFILIVVDPKKENGDAIKKQVRVPVGFQKF